MRCAVAIGELSGSNNFPVDNRNKLYIKLILNGLWSDAESLRAGIIAMADVPLKVIPARFFSKNHCLQINSYVLLALALRQGA
jgi:hypothetical protein